MSACGHTFCLMCQSNIGTLNISMGIAVAFICYTVSFIIMALLSFMGHVDASMGHVVSSEAKGSIYILKTVTS